MSITTVQRERGLRHLANLTVDCPTSNEAWTEEIDLKCFQFVGDEKSTYTSYPKVLTNNLTRRSLVEKF